MVLSSNIPVLSLIWGIGEGFFCSIFSVNFDRLGDCEACLRLGAEGVLSSTSSIDCALTFDGSVMPRLASGIKRVSDSGLASLTP